MEDHHDVSDARLPLWRSAWGTGTRGGGASWGTFVAGGIPPGREGGGAERREWREGPGLGQ